MRIPLDYYRILGLPIQATAEQLQQAFRDRTLQLPRREYSEAAIAARRQLLDEAYSVLSDPAQRKAYDAGFLAKTYEPGQPLPSSSAGEGQSSQTAQSDIDPNTPSIEIDEAQFVGALLILQELGEYELVLKLGRPYLSSSFSLNNVRLRDRKLILPDIVLTVALACLELGREQWQQGQYENAAASLQTGQDTLLKEGLFANVRGEIQADIYKLRPYRILELLAIDNRPESDRQRGLQLLKEVLHERGGIDGSGDDQSGLNIDDFLRFIQQLRSYLTAAEQQYLFEEEARRPSAVATYLAVYALLGKGFAERQPVLIRRAKLMLMRLSKRQDVHLEQSVCALLLGQTEEASRALELSQEYEPLAFIREHSQGSPDLLPGLCLYGERWLQEEVFPHFRDLAEKRTSLKEYFADESVQAYLEALPNDTEAANEWSAIDAQPIVSGHMANRAGIAQAGAGSPDYRRTPLSTGAGSKVASLSQVRSGQVRSQSLGQRTPTAATLSSTLEPSSTGTNAIPTANSGSTSAGNAGSVRLQPPQRTRQPAVEESNGSRPKAPPSQPSRHIKPGIKLVAAPKSVKVLRLAVVFLLAIIGISGLIFLSSRTIAWFQQAFTQPSRREEPWVGLDRPILPVPESEAPSLFEAKGPLTEATAKQVVEGWLTIKAKALGPQHQIESLEDILVNPALSKRQRQAEEAKRKDWHWRYEHSVPDVSVNIRQDNPDRAEVVAAVKETAMFYDSGNLDEDSSYKDDNLKVTYDLVRQDGQWRIRDMAVR